MELTSIAQGEGPGERRRENRQSSQSLSVSFRPDQEAAVRSAVTQTLENYSWPRGYSFDLGQGLELCDRVRAARGRLGRQRLRRRRHNVGSRYLRCGHDRPARRDRSIHVRDARRLGFGARPDLEPAFQAFRRLGLQWSRVRGRSLPWWCCVFRCVFDPGRDASRVRHDDRPWPATVRQSGWGACARLRGQHAHRRRHRAV